jgi:hypothetical protein
MPHVARKSRTSESPTDAQSFSIGLQRNRRRKKNPGAKLHRGKSSKRRTYDIAIAPE